MDPPPSKRTRLELDLQQKVQLINDHRSSPKTTQRHLSAKYGIGTSTVSDILKNAHRILDMYESPKNVNKNTKRLDTKCKFQHLNKLTWAWFTQARSQQRLTGPIVQDKATEFARVLGFEDFKASNGWLSSWKSRYGVKSFNSSEEGDCGVREDDTASEDVSLSVGSSLPAVLNNVNPAVDDWIRQLVSLRVAPIVDGYPPADIFHCAEFGLLFRALPHDTPSDSQIGEHLTVLFACSLTGAKLKPLVVGNSQQPRCFRDVLVSQLPASYTSSPDTRLTPELFEDWLCDLNYLVCREDRQILVCVADTTPHQSRTDFSHVSLRSLGADTHSALQPVTPTVIRSFKDRYRRQLLTHILARTGGGRGTSAELVTVLNALTWIHRAWTDTKVTVQTDNDTEVRPAGLLPLSTLMDKFPDNTVTEDEYLDMDSSAATRAVDTDDLPQEPAEDSVSTTDSGTSPLLRPKLTPQEIQTILEDLQHYACTKNPAMLPAVAQLAEINDTDLINSF